MWWRKNSSKSSSCSAKNVPVTTLKWKLCVCRIARQCGAQFNFPTSLHPTGSSHVITVLMSPVCSFCPQIYARKFNQLRVMMTVGSSQPGYGATTEKFDLFRGATNTLTHTYASLFWWGWEKASGWWHCCIAAAIQGRKVWRMASVRGCRWWLVVGTPMPAQGKIVIKLTFLDWMRSGEGRGSVGCCWFCWGKVHYGKRRKFCLIYVAQ